MLKHFFGFVENHFGAYIAACCCLGLAIRWHLAGGDFATFLNPLFFGL